MKKLLFITYQFGKYSPVGVGAERIVVAFAKQGFHVFVITSKSSDITIPNVDIIVKSNIPKLPHVLSNKIANLIGKNFYYFAWKMKVYLSAKSILYKNPDIIAIYTRATPSSVSPFVIKLKNKFHKPLLMHFTDPIPAPEEWLPEVKTRKRLIKEMNFLLPYVDRVSFGNRYMLQYEESILNHSLQNKAFLSPDPAISDLKILPQKNSEMNNNVNLLFLGNIYGNRNPSCLFEAIKRLSEYPIKMYLYGNNQGAFPEFVISKGRTNDIFSVMQEADILVDIDGDDKTPVFISSKLKDYLAVNRPILAITPFNSPSREILNGLSTVGIANNTIQEIENTLLKLINTNYSDSDFEERKSIINSFNSDIIVSDIIKQINILNK